MKDKQIYVVVGVMVFFEGGFYQSGCGPHRERKNANAVHLKTIVVTNLVKFVYIINTPKVGKGVAEMSVSFYHHFGSAAIGTKHKLPYIWTVSCGISCLRWQRLHRQKGKRGFVLWVQRFGDGFGG